MIVNATLHSQRNIHALNSGYRWRRQWDPTSYTHIHIYLYICIYIRVAAPRGGGRSGVWLYTRNWCIRNGLERETKFGTVWLCVRFDLMEPSLALKLRRSAHGDPRGPVLALCWKTYKPSSIVNPFKNCSTASNGSTVKVCPVVEFLYKARMRITWRPKCVIYSHWKCEFAIFVSRLKAKIHDRFALKVRIRYLRKPKPKYIIDSCWKCEFAIFPKRVKAKHNYRFTLKVRIHYLRKPLENPNTL